MGKSILHTIKITGHQQKWYLLRFK